MEQQEIDTGFCYRRFDVRELPDAYKAIIAMALNELPDFPIGFLVECNPDEVEIKKDTSVNGLCMFNENMVFVVVKDATTSIETLFHECRHWRSHRTAVSQQIEGDPLAEEFHNKFVERLAKEMKANSDLSDKRIQELLTETMETDADNFASERLELFKMRYPDEFQKAQKASEQWINDNNFGAYNKSLPDPGIPDWALQKFTDDIRKFNHKQNQ